MGCTTQLSTALCKTMDFYGGKINIDKSLTISHKNTKTWTKGEDIKSYFKANCEAMGAYKRSNNKDASGNPQIEYTII